MKNTNKEPCPVLDPVEMVYVPDDIFSLTLIDPRYHHGVRPKAFSKDPKSYCPRCQTDHVRYTAIEKMKASCCDEPIMVAEHLFVGPTGPIHTRCTRDHSDGTK